MKVKCHIVSSDRGYEGVIVNDELGTIYNTGFQPCPEDADGLMAGIILRKGWEVVPWGQPTGGVEPPPNT